ncbi:MAG TPA: FAD-dependent oxidoreductase [Acidimicrobiales bacterium]|nr:FAD-dependent oxidoreductase [Acidimicrobiales bacterium]
MSTESPSTADPIAPVDAAEVTRWDAECDVVVTGFGAAGSAAAFTAAEGGAEVVVAERAGGAGGAAALAEGIVYLGGGTPIQTACGFSDSVDDMFRFMMAACGPEPDETKIAAYCDHSLDHFDWLVARGVPFDPSFCAETSMAPTGEEGLVYSGGEDAYPFDRIARPAPRGHLAKTKRATGWLLMQHLAAAAQAAGAAAHFDTRVDRLVVDGGRVVGVQARHFAETVHLRARRGVVLTAGGFVFNDDMLRQHCAPLVRGTFKVGTEGDDGRAIRMAQALGAAVRNMWAGEVSLPITPPRGLIRGILVNGRGQRFVNEDTYMGRVGRAALYEQDGEAYLIVDEEAYEPNWMGLKATWVCETVTELEAEIGLPAGSLETTVALYNRHAERGEDPVFHKGAGWVRPLRGALGAFDLRTGPAPYAPFTLGGLDTTVDGAVLDLAGLPLPGLFAAGRTTAGVCALGYASGLSIGDSTMFGRFAGRSAATAPT